MTSTKVRSYFLFRFFFFFLFSLIALTYEQALSGVLVAASKYTREKITGLKRETHEPTIVVGNFNTPLPITERTSRQKDQPGSRRTN